MNEGNLYNMEDEISHKRNASIIGISKLQMEIRKKIIDQLLKQNIPNVEKIIKKTFGETTDQQ